MKLLLMDIPEDPTALAGWLERQLMGPDLRALVAELAAVHGSAGDVAPGDLLGEHRETVLVRGLGTLPAEVLRQLLRQPGELLHLQEQILTEGWPYWLRLAGQSEELAGLARRGERRLEEIWGEPAPAVLPLRRPGVAWYRRPWFASLATAAAVLIVVYFWPRPPGPVPPPIPPDGGQVVVNPPTGAPAGWGWDRPGALPQDAKPADYLNRLADAAEEWSKQRSDDAAGLAKRIGEMRQGCSTLIFAEHKPLSDEDRRWLVRFCKRWASELDKERAALEAGQPVAQVRAEADATVRQIVEVLRTRAESL
jgi:hypothetical protein